KYLARDNAETLGLVGAGLQAIAHLEALSQVMKIKEVKVWSRTRETVGKFIQNMTKQYSKIKFTAAHDVREAVEKSDVVATLTPSRQPIVMPDWVKPGTHINAMGADAPRKQELNFEILKKAKIVVDDLEHCSHSGEINVPLAEGQISRHDIYGEIGEIILGRKPGRTISRRNHRFRLNRRSHSRHSRSRISLPKSSNARLRHENRLDRADPGTAIKLPATATNRKTN
ncbi:hypothetical protein GWN42_23125, partial [candidate division KSB1 bacterium]|nr:hypothetical protein [candidate division KSB1 bacterium]